MARSTTRAQRASQSQPTQSQTQRAPRGSNSQRARRRNDEEDEEDENEDEENEVEGEEQVDVNEVAEDGGDEDLQRRAHALVRLALFNEQRRLPLRRDEISKKVLGSKSRQFGEILQLAQQTLRKTFGMELVELQRGLQGGELDAGVGNGQNKDKDGKKEKKKGVDALGMKKKAAPSGTKTWILRSVLDDRLISLAVSPDNDIKTVEQEHRMQLAEADLVGINGDETDDEDAAAVRSTNTGAILAWQGADQLSAVGVLYVVLALVLVHGRSISDTDLRRTLKRLRIPFTADLPLNTRSATPTTIDSFLTQCTRQGYLERRRVGEVKPGSKKRGRGPPGGTQRPGGGNDENEGDTWEWKWGMRAMAEVGEVGVARFVAEFMVDGSMVGAGEEEEEEEDAEAGEERRRRKVETMMKGVERASGGELVEIPVVVV
ncbi:MAGE family-domain-containing protein [Irpex rosettiformis]|uniref:MAGE family-domain-containing protein n=1 Tax=Irpex rosettiformis TaxID=378272 RepID=A0ACB8U6E3_9APHY|nr:MAGE family-domain-containing protein [Irpex rosettiformis]